MPTPDQVKEQIKRLCDHVLPARQAQLLRYLTSLPQKDFATRKSKDILIGFEERHPSRSRGQNSSQTPLDRARRLVYQLSVSLERYYSKRPDTAPDRVLIEIEKPHSADEHRYEPKIDDWPVQRKVAQPHQEFRHLGDIFAALDHVTEQIPRLNRIEETFFRWVERRASFYADGIFAKYVEALEKSRLLYRAVLGPMTDPAIFSPGGLRQILENRVRALPTGERSAKVYRLLHDAPLMDFTLLYYVEDPNDFQKRTNKVEVLFGYGVHDQWEQPDATVVFSSTEPRLVNEFRKLFEVLRDGQFSRRLEIGRPGQFQDEPRRCDILATFPRLPEAEVLRKIRASGTGVGSGEPHIKICVSALKFLDDQTLKRELKEALTRGVRVSIALWGRGVFITLRTHAIGIDLRDAQREMEGSRSLVEFLGQHENLTKRMCHSKTGSVSLIWIDDLIYFSAYWIGKNVADGPHFLTMADSETGRELQFQYEQMLSTSDPWED